MNKKTQHVVPGKDGKWKVKKGGSTKAYKTFDTQDEAKKAAIKISKNQGAELYIHRKDGTIIEKNSYGKDPHPPKG